MQPKQHNIMETLRTLRDYGRFLGIRGLYRKKKADLKEYILDTVFEEIQERMARRPNLDPVKASIKAELSLCSKKLTREKTWRQLFTAAKENEISRTVGPQKVISNAA